MRTRVAQFDLGCPAPVWALEGYPQALVLVRDGSFPLGLMHLSLRDQEAVLTVERLREAMEEQPPRASPALAGDCAESPPISVVVCTRDRPLALRRCLEMLGCLGYPRFEVVVVDNASRTSLTEQIVRSTPFRYVREDTPGLDWARNRGWREASYGIVAYVDDDVRVDARWLDGVARGFGDPAVGAVTGLVLPEELETTAQHLFERYGGMSKGFAVRVHDRSKMGWPELIAAHSVGVGANMAFRKNSLARLGGFDTALDVGTPSGGGGDLDMLHRLLCDGSLIRYEPTALVWHQHRRAMGDLSRQLHNNGRSFGVYLIKRYREGRVPGGAVAAYALRDWLGNWLLHRLAGAVLRRERFPLSLILAEWWGALHAPWAYFATYRHDRETLRRHASRPVTSS